MDGQRGRTAVGADVCSPIVHPLRRKDRLLRVLEACLDSTGDCPSAHLRPHGACAGGVPRYRGGFHARLQLRAAAVTRSKPVCHPAIKTKPPSSVGYALPSGSSVVHAANDTPAHFSCRVWEERADREGRVHSSPVRHAGVGGGEGMEWNTSDAKRLSSVFVHSRALRGAVLGSFARFASISPLHGES